MKKLLVFVMALCLAFGAAAAEPAEKAPLALDEVNAFNQALLEMAVKAGLKAEAEGQVFAVRGEGFGLNLKSQDVSADSFVLEAVIEQDGLALTGPRGTIVTMPLRGVLAAFPNDNAELAGTRESAVLYLRGEKGQDIQTGVITRDGQKVLMAEYTVYKKVEGGYDVVGLVYTFLNGAVSAIRGYAALEKLDDAHVDERLARLRELQEQTHYVMRSFENASFFGREDFSVMGLDMLTLTPDALTAKLGQPAHIETIDDEDGNTLKTYDWESLAAVFAFDEKDQFLYTDRLTLSSGGIDGPRAITVGDTLDVAVSRFENKAESLSEERVPLYGDSEKGAPYGLLMNDPDASTLYYAADFEGRTMLLTLTLVDGVVAEISLGYL